MKKISFLAICILTLFSCQKEINDLGPDPIPDPNPGTVDSTLLVQLILLDTTQVAGSDTLAKEDYSYDSQKRLSAIGDYLTYSYDNNDTLPSKIVFNYSGYTHFLKYDANGKIIRDSLFTTDNGFKYTTVERYTNSNNLVLDSVKYYTLNISTGVTTTDEGTSFIQYSYQNENLSSLSQGSVLSSGDSLYEEYALTYDNHPNPVQNHKYQLVYFMDYPLLPVVDFEQKNNCTSFKYTLHSSGTSDVQRSFNVVYKYRADGYPVEASIIEDPGPYSDSEPYNKIIYKYKH